MQRHNQNAKIYYSIKWFKLYGDNSYLNICMFAVIWMITGPVFHRGSSMPTLGGARMPLKSVVSRGPSDDADQDQRSAGGGGQVTVCFAEKCNYFQTSI